MEPDVRINTERTSRTREWIENQLIQENDANASSCESEELEDIESSVVSSDLDSDNETTLSSTTLGTQIATTDCDVSVITENLKELFNSVNHVQTVGNVRIENSTGVHIGNVTNINGNIQIIHAGDKCRPKRRKKCTVQQQKLPLLEEREERCCPDAFNTVTKFKIPKELCAIIPRSTWLAQTPMNEPSYLKEPIEYVVISHTATESSEKQAINIRIIRDIQCFHIESREWDDIAYNFLVGCDGNIYEGRGWGVVGAHTRGYNTRSIGISFIGCFMRVLPTEKALNACKNLLKLGMENGRLSSNYKLICHCQCRSTESPGRKLFEELQKWEHFYHIEEDDADDII